MLLGLLALLGLTLLFVPWRFRLRAEADLAAADGEDALTGRAEGRLRLRWGVLNLAVAAAWNHGAPVQWDVRLLGRPLKGGGRGAAARRPGRWRRRGTPGRRARRRPGRRPSPALLKAVVQELARLPGRFWRSLGTTAAGELTYGFSDPSVTGFCEAVRWGTGLGRSLRLSPDFSRPCLVGWAELTGSLYGFRLLIIAWRVLRRREIWNYLVGQIRFRPIRQILMQGGS